MQFQNPNFLWALGFLAVPILIHLFNLRRHKTIYFSDIRFLKDVQQSTNKQRTIKEWLVLTMRMLALAALVFAFAKPFIPAENQSQTPAKVVVFLDNSPSTTVGLGELNPLERGKQLAQNLVKTLPSQVEIALITAQDQGIAYYTSVDGVLEKIKQILPVDLPMTYETSHFEKNTAVYAITDFQKNNQPDFSTKKDSLQWVILPTIKNEESHLANVSIDSVWIDAPILIAGQAVDVFIKLKNYGAETSEINVEILANNLPEVNISASLNSTADTIIQATLTQLKSGFNTAKINILNDDVLFDNRNMQSYFLPISNNIVEIYGENPSPVINKIFSGNEFLFASMSAKSVDKSSLENADLIILNQLTEIGSGLSNLLLTKSDEANIFIIPSPKNRTETNALTEKLGGFTYGNLDTAKLQTQQINTTDPFFAQVFSGSIKDAYWPAVNKHFRFSKAARLPSFKLMTLANGDPIFIRIAREKTNIFQLAMPLNKTYSELENHPIVIPIFIKALLKKDNISSFSGTLGKSSKFTFSTNKKITDSPMSVTGNGLNFIPRQQIIGEDATLLLGDEITKLGTYDIIYQDEKLGNISFNGVPKESNLERYSISEYQEVLAQTGAQNVHIIESEATTIGKTLAEWQLGLQLWKYCLALTLCFILFEIILLRFLK